MKWGEHWAIHMYAIHVGTHLLCANITGGGFPFSSVEGGGEAAQDAIQAGTTVLRLIVIISDI
jgi:hypothetical protein